MFELTRDMADPTKDYFPFLLNYKELEKNSENSGFFFCFMYVESAGKFLDD
jgi:hypothetical protein